VRVGGRKAGGDDSEHSEVEDSHDEAHDDHEDGRTKPKIFSQKRKECRVTSRIGDLATQKLSIPENC
jgi:hypothetical protein